MKKVLKKVAICLMIMAMVMTVLPVGVQAAGKQVNYVAGTHYTLGNISKIKFSGSKVTISGTFYDDDWNESSKKTVTYKVPSKLKYYEIEDGIYYQGKVKRANFKKQCQTYMKNRFPEVHIWIKSGKILSYATSA